MEKRSADDMRARSDEQMTARERSEPQHPAEPRRAAAESPQAVVPVPPLVNKNGENTMLFPDADAERLRTQWTDIQADFVDAPRRAVERADALVADAMRRLSEVFAGERANLEGQWDRGDKITTEDLRVALQRYRAFFDRLLSI